MRARHTRIVFQLALFVSVAPLAAVGPCYTIGEQAVLNGFFNAVNPLLLQAAEDALGISGTTSATSSDGSTNSAGSGTTKAATSGSGGASRTQQGTASNGHHPY